MNVQHEPSGAESSSETRRTRVLEPIPSQLDAEHDAAPRVRSSATQRPTVGNDHGRAAGDVGTGSSADTVGVERLRSPSQASPPPLEH